MSGGVRFVSLCVKGGKYEVDEWKKKKKYILLYAENGEGWGVANKGRRGKSM